MDGSWYGDKATSHVVRAPAQDRRREPRVDVMMHVKGELVRLDTAILVHDMSRTGFSVLSRLSFESGQQLDFRLIGEDGTTVVVTAQAMHSRPMPSDHTMHLSGFMFVPGRLTGLVPQALIDRLISTVADPEVPCFFERR